MDRNRCACALDLKRFMIRSRRLVGRCEFSARVVQAFVLAMLNLKAHLRRAAP